MLKFSRLDRKRRCDLCSRSVDVLIAFMGDERATVTSRHLVRIGRGFCGGSLDGAVEPQ